MTIAVREGYQYLERILVKWQERLGFHIFTLARYDIA
jgi:hypothetical protein